MPLVGIDTNGLYTTQAGLARYIRGLLKGLKCLGTPDIDLRVVAWEVQNFSYRQPQRAFKTFYRELIWAKFSAPLWLRKCNIALLHSTAGPLISTPRGIKEVVTLHDLAVLRYPERFRSWHLRVALGRMQRLRSADQVICISRFTATEAMALLNLPASSLTVIHNGCDFHQGESAPPERRPDFSLPNEYFLFVGSLEPGKNLALLKEVYAVAESRKIVLPPLLIVGARWEGIRGEGPPPKNWHYLGRLPDEILVYLYRHAMGLVFPSKYEGFGLPVAEAMSLGCPVICSAVASLPEVAGAAALFAEMTPGAYLEAMRRISADAILRGELVEMGLVQADKFSWRRCAEQAVEVYRAMLRSS
ncbi:MAG TPA: glycosyltransferase family 1 protein [Verrucomicrobiae bacterium]|nr:glycosyltransferase family 1 protein [Verrucomicrobiae bacterium]